ncbi:conserved hypothetical protein [Echinococcus multilocularis]|uniref:Uncharacterized protein n=1 Tax=Echinococcus multilocularis TaxID=6211 RepID=A0A068YNH2_ECHMU|nr:conserved hypothetical protein [Echinococcus multilocularis]
MKSRRSRTSTSKCEVVEYITPSKRLLDPLPSAPTAADSHQRIIGKIDRSALTMYLQILASSDYVLPNSDADPVSPEVNQKVPYTKNTKLRKLGDRISLKNRRQSIFLPETLLEEDGKLSKEFLFKQTLALGASDAVRDALIKRELSLADFRPLKAPFVPYILKVLVNAIEKDCNRQGWDVIFNQSSSTQRELAELHACLLIQNWNHHHHVKRQVGKIPLPLKITTLRVLLSGFKQKPLHFNKQVLKEVIKRPLFDLFLRPNPNIKSLVRHTALPCNRTTMDTLAFMMFHLQHAWEHGANPIATKGILAKLYGPLLVSFSERPAIIDQDPMDCKTEEAAILEVVLEMCNSQFWDNLSMLKMHLAFDSDLYGEEEKTKEEEEGIDSLNDLNVKTSDEPSEYENEAWFSNLFASDLCAMKSAAVEPKPQSVIMPWGKSILADCRPRPLKVKPLKETPEQRIERAKKEVAAVLHGSVHDWKPPPFHEDLHCGPPSHLGDVHLHHVYLRRRLRSTSAILRDVSREARLPKGKDPPKFLQVPARVQTHLTCPPTPPPPSPIQKSKSDV